MNIMNSLSKKIVNHRINKILNQMESLLQDHNPEKDSIVNLYAEQNKNAFKIINVLTELENSKNAVKLLSTLDKIYRK
ncbi:MAG: hypothetical protein ABXS91_08785 [Sulfurimonas sp.]